MLVSGATFSFSGFTGSILGLSVETPSAEIVDMTSVLDKNNAAMLVPTGALVGGSITIDFYGLLDPQGLVGRRAVLVMSSAKLTVSRNVILEKASVDVKTSEAVRGTLTFRMTDYYGN